MTNEEMQIVLDQMGKKAKRAAIALAVLPDDAKRGCLEAMAAAIERMLRIRNTMLILPRPLRYQHYLQKQLQELCLFSYPY